MSLFSSLFNRVTRSKGDPISEVLNRPEEDPSKWDERWQLLYERLVRIFEGRGHDNADDLAEQVIFILIRRGNYDIGKPETFHTALNIADKVKRNEQRRRRKFERHDEFDEHDILHGSKPSPHAALEEEERRRVHERCADEALNKLRPKDRELFLIYKSCLASGMSAAECAVRLRMNKQTLKNKASLLLMKVGRYARRCLERFGY